MALLGLSPSTVSTTPSRRSTNTSHTGEGDQPAGTMVAPGILNVFDEQGFSATFGVQSLVTPKTGETHRASAASLVLFNKDKASVITQNRPLMIT
jgi:hypothetical protein